MISSSAGRSRELGRSPFDVVAWHGNYAPYKYDLSNFNTMVNPAPKTRVVGSEITAGVPRP